MFNADSDGGKTTIGRVLRRREFTATRYFLRLEDCDARQEKSLEALILLQATAGGPGIACQLCNALTGVTQEATVTRLSDHEEGFECMTLLLATVILWLLFGIFRAVDRTFGAIMPKRGVVDLRSGACVSNIAANSAAVRAGSSSWSAKA